MLQVSDRQLADVVSRLIMQHSQSSTSVEDMRLNYERLQSENNSLRSAHQDLQVTCRRLQSDIDNINAEIKTRENSYLLKESTLKQEVNKAVDIADKQVAVVQMLESKVNCFLASTSIQLITKSKSADRVHYTRITTEILSVADD